MIIDPEDIESCEKHQCNFVIGDACHLCEAEEAEVIAKESAAPLEERIGILESFLRAAINDGGASKNLKDCARNLLKQ